MNDKNLKSCPFCGGKAEIEKDNDYDIHGFIIGEVYYVSCNNVPNCYIYPCTAKMNNIQDAIEAWNYRK